MINVICFLVFFFAPERGLSIDITQIAHPSQFLPSYAQKVAEIKCVSLKIQVHNEVFNFILT